MKSQDFFKMILRFFGSLKLAIFLILTLAVVLSLATFYEATYGTSAAQYSIYKTVGFGLLLVLMGVNVLCAALKKYPWKRHQIGFLVTHLGLITIIVGSFVTFQWGIDAQMPLMNGEAKNFLLLDEEIIEVELKKEGIHWSEVLEIGPYERKEPFVSFEPDAHTTVVADRYFPFAKEKTTVFEGNGKFSAIRLNIANNFVNFDEWLFMNERGKNEVSLGPATVTYQQIRNRSELKKFLKSAKSESKPTLGTLELMVDARSWTMPLTSDHLNGTVRFKESPFKIKNVRYYTHAIVEGNRLVNRPSGSVNPAVQLTLVGPKGSEEHVAFSYFPNFPSTHQKSSLYNAKLGFIASENNISSTQKTLAIGVTKSKKVYYRVTSSSGILTGKVKIGEAYATGWMNLTFSIKEQLNHADQKVNYEPIQVKDPNNPKAPSVMRLKFSKAGIPDQYEWLAFGQGREISYAGKDYQVSFHPNVMPIGFDIHLAKFEMGTDPGTDNPASYQSRVILDDQAVGLKQKHVISMNEPLKYKGYYFYQASYQTDDLGKPIGSVLSVGYDPGRILKYGGSIFLVCGIMLMFFFRKTYMNLIKSIQERRKKHHLIAQEEQVAF